MTTAPPGPVLQRLAAKYFPAAPPDSRRLFYTYEPGRHARLALESAAFARRLAGFLRRAARPPALYLHVPYCRRRCLYCTCNAVACSDPRRVRTLVPLLLAELDLLAEVHDRAGLAPRFDTVHVGGGSPTVLADDDFARLAGRLRDLVGTHRPREFALEVDPRAVDPRRLAFYRRCGVDRLSIGVQDFDPHVLAAVGRPQPSAVVEALFAPDVRAAFPSLGIDLLYGLPCQTVRSWERTLATVVRLRPDRVEVNLLNVNPGHGQLEALRRRGPLPDPAARVTMDQLTVDTLLADGYVQTGFDHFALPHDRLARAGRRRTLRRNLLGYTPGSFTDVIGVGPTANTELGPLRLKNEALAPWSDAVGNGRFAAHEGLRLRPSDLLRADVIHELLTWFRVDIPAIERRHGVRFATIFARERRALREFVADGLLELDDRALTATDVGRRFVLPMAWVFAR